jgi:hypothetical protein
MVVKKTMVKQFLYITGQVLMVPGVSGSPDFKTIAT